MSKTSESLPVMQTPREVADLLLVKPATVYRWLREGVLPSVRIGGTVRVPADAIERLLAEHKEMT